MKKLNKILSVGLSLAMCAGMVMPALAATYNIQYGNVTIGEGWHGGYTDENAYETHSWDDDKEVIITGTTDKHNVTVENGATANITLKDATIDSSSTGKAAIDIGDSSNLTIELDGTNEVKSGAGKAGVSVGDGASLTINDTKETEKGSLTATGGDGGGAGIGGDKNANSGSVTINGGTITATGGNAYGIVGSGGAGIGTAENGTMDSITINDGVVDAHGTGSSAGIGTGAQSHFNFDKEPSLGKISIDGGTVTAKGDTDGAGIGTGASGGRVDTIQITGGNVTATGVNQGAGIGTGCAQGWGADNRVGTTSIGKIDIDIGDGESVTASNVSAEPGRGSAGAGIGLAGDNFGPASIESINIKTSGTGTVTATGGKSGGAGIGTGYAYAHDVEIGKIDISGSGTVIATSNIYSAGIGSGHSSALPGDPLPTNKVGTINISGSTVNATAGSYGAGIGAGWRSKVGDINISGGTVNATGGATGAGIGAGYESSFGAVNITGGDIVATSGRYASGIGNGMNGKGGTIAIKGTDSLMVLGDLYYAIDTRVNSWDIQQSILNGRFKEELDKADSNGLTQALDTEFVVVDAEGNEIKRFTLTADDDFYNSYGYGDFLHESFATLLPEGTYYVFEDSNRYNGSVAGYKEDPGKQIAYVIEESKMLTAPLMQFPSYNVSYKFESGTEGRTLPDEIANMQLEGSTGNKLNYANFLEMVKRGDSFKEVHSDGGTWRFNTWTEMRPVTADGQKITDVELVGTWSFCGHENKTTTNIKDPTCTEPGESKTVCDDCGEVISTGDVVPPLDHDYGEWTVVTPATCTEDGLEQRVCSRDASHVEEQVLPATDHDWDGGVITRQPTETEEGVMTYTCRHDPSHTYTVSIPRLVPSITIEDLDVPMGEEPEVEIEDPDVPLAGLFTRADAIGYLWEQTGSPDAELSDFPDVPEDHYWAVAIGWAQDMGIALPDEDGNFRPDDPVLRSSAEPEGELQEFLNRYAVFAGAAEQGETFIQLSGASDDVIMGEEAQVIFDDFFAKLEAALAKQAA